MKPTFVYITCKNEGEAEKIGRSMVEEQLAACANILPKMRSLYMWEGKLTEDNETVLILKSHAALSDALISRVRALHSYDTPAVLVLPIVHGNMDYLEWMAGEMQV